MCFDAFSTLVSHFKTHFMFHCLQHKHLFVIHSLKEMCEKRMNGVCVSASSFSSFFLFEFHSRRDTCDNTCDILSMFIRHISIYLHPYCIFFLIFFFCCWPVYSMFSLFQVHQVQHHFQFLSPFVPLCFFFCDLPSFAVIEIINIYSWGGKER